ncbi:response regulator [endosymbiont of Ridgeia piscesae]|uniref:CheY chemotaxis protein or a CheY-like REC (Receiver) domain n=1 Tax=endosymbiont of Ridgeia piscesae TaxID=54398 RepID=A0A0T5YU63_9GAMM|nr:response regulator [endosymbiont of Ridgeia piscesae]KRT54130.1 CheY chemotaxis protein or a CheY-like REC (receiver) domain [endosymbiont of Ridgeia piscesae]KRT59219.1 CheY chemotaxis protein or a CheY-like REC (receiver) domain [endosymbiont of Ridgeia piscesae]
MKKKHALIVDDSKTARRVLAKKLDSFHVDVSEVGSGKEAIEFLKKAQPDAVFMDYHMPGMDGIQALKFIRLNPETASIPVMMYTSHSEKLKPEQVKALGAVGVLPKNLDSKDFEIVISMLKLEPEGEPDSQFVDSMNIDETPSVQLLDGASEIAESSRLLHDAARETEASVGSTRLRKQIAKLLAQHLKLVRRHIDETSRQTVEEMEKGNSAIENRLLEMQQAEAEQSKAGGLSWVMLLFLLLLGGGALLLSGWRSEMVEERNTLREQITLMEKARANYDEQADSLASLLEQQGGVSVGDKAAGITAAEQPEAWMKLLEWALNRDLEFAYRAVPFDDKMVSWLSQALDHLGNAGFRGTLLLEARYGDFCLTGKPDAQLELAADELKGADCLFSRQLSADGSTRNELQSISFTNYINSSPRLSAGPIKVQVKRGGYDTPVVPYPEAREEVSAVKWNQVAARNQRIQVRLLPAVQ